MFFWQRKFSLGASGEVKRIEKDVAVSIVILHLLKISHSQM